MPRSCFVAQALIAKLCSTPVFDAAMTCCEGLKGVIEIGWFSPKFRVSEPRDGEFFTTRIDRFSAIAGPGFTHAKWLGFCSGTHTEAFTECGIRRFEPCGQKLCFSASCLESGSLPAAWLRAWSCFGASCVNYHPLCLSGLSRAGQSPSFIVHGGGGCDGLCLDSHLPLCSL
ncbi:hypothetical protein QF013_001489 [Pseudomonas laurylsulfatiphila]|nr:hypothetical protein [Pseudomonas reinekei]